jgi:hypothetical protein
MSTVTTYAIVKIANAYAPDIQGIGRSRVVACGLTAEAATERIDELDNDVYVTSNGEAGRPEYILIEDYGVEEGQTIGHEDGSMYDWDRIDCNHEDDDGDKCGECQSCIEGMITQDQELVRGMAVEVA